MSQKDYPLHPGQTHPEPYYCTIPLEEYEQMKARIKELEEMCRWRKIDEEPPDTTDHILFAGFLKYDYEEQGELIVDMGSFNYEGLDAHDGRLWNTYNDWYEGQETYRIDYWRPLPRHPEEK